MSARVFGSLAELEALVGQDVAASGWMEVSPERIAKFAEATDDYQWIHLDAERAARESPFGGVVAHGFLTLSLLAPLKASAVTINGVSMALNYGANRVRFPAPLRAGRRVQGRFKLLKFEPIEGGAQLTWESTVIEEGATKPCCVAESITRCYTERR
jgi:acyl dehydratase